MTEYRRRTMTFHRIGKSEPASIDVLEPVDAPETGLGEVLRQRSETPIPPEG
jgi:hypothetical protein